MDLEHTGDDFGSVDIDPESPLFHAHLSRYWWARARSKDAAVLDCACGKGYGTYLLASAARSAMGVDLNPDSVAAAADTFRRPNLEYRALDALRARDLGRRFDVITAFEIIEHIEEAQTDRFLSGLGACLLPGGRLLVSTPNHTVVQRSGSMIPDYHINNFTPHRLRRTLRRHFDQVTLLGQFRAGSPLYRVLFSLDVWNLRHVVGSLVGKGADSEPGHTAGSGMARAESLLASGYFESEPPASRGFRISPWHWRQAGITLAICESPTGTDAGRPAP